MKKHYTGSSVLRPYKGVNLGENHNRKLIKFTGVSSKPFILINWCHYRIHQLMHLPSFAAFFDPEVEILLRPKHYF